MKTIAQILKHDFSKGNLYLYNSNGNQIYCEDSYGYWYKQEYNDNGNLIYCDYSKGYWYKQEFDVNGNRIYYEDSTEYWCKQEFDDNGNCIYFENSMDYIVDNRPKASCDGKVVDIDGKRYQLKEVD
jgi:hypothetical protein